MFPQLDVPELVRFQETREPPKPKPAPVKRPAATEEDLQLRAKPTKMKRQNDPEERRGRLLMAWRRVVETNSGAFSIGRHMKDEASSVETIRLSLAGKTSGTLASRLTSMTQLVRWMAEQDHLGMDPSGSERKGMEKRHWRL